jgi:hypothetical protein
MADV